MALPDNVEIVTEKKLPENSPVPYELCLDAKDDMFGCRFYLGPSDKGTALLEVTVHGLDEDGAVLDGTETYENFEFLFTPQALLELCSDFTYNFEHMFEGPIPCMEDATDGLMHFFE